MIDRELYEAEELDFYVETHQAGQAAQLQFDLPVGERCLAEKLLGISAIAGPDVHFLVNLENQIHETARKPDETIVFDNNSNDLLYRIMFAPDDPQAGDSYRQMEDISLMTINTFHFTR